MNAQNHVISLGAGSNRFAIAAFVMALLSLLGSIAVLVQQYQLRSVVLKMRTTINRVDARVLKAERARENPTKKEE